MNKSKNLKFFGGRSVIATLSNLGLAAASPTHAISTSQEIVDDSPYSHAVDHSDLSLDLSIAGFRTLKEAAEAIPVAGGPLKATCGIMTLILQLAKRCKENQEGWEKLANVIKEKNESIIGLLKLYSKAPADYPSTERQAKEYQRVLNNIAVDIKKETQRKSEASKCLETYWSRIQSTGRAAVLASINAEKIKSYQEQLQGLAFDVIEKAVIHQALTMTETNMAINDMRADLRVVLTGRSSLKAPVAILKPRPRRVRDFMGRSEILDSMWKTHFGHEGSLSPDDGPIITVLTGMGGSGKTQIAVKFASLFEERCPNTPVFFLDASSETSLMSNLFTLVRLQTNKYDDALAWLANGITDWLLIMDNADEPSLKLSQFIPRCGHGHIVITTRNATHKLLSPRSTHVVDVLSVEDSVALLLTSSGNDHNDENRSLAREIVEELGRLPLALGHAAAYILINSCLDTFLATYRENWDQFLKSTPDLPQGYPHSVERTIEMSFSRLSPRVKHMMQLFAYMDARFIPRRIIEEAAERKFVHIPKKSRSQPHHDTEKQSSILSSIFCPGGKWNAFEFDGMIGECLKYSLLQLSTEDGEKFYAIHPLVQMYLKAILDCVQDHSARRLVVRLLASATTVGRQYQFFRFNRLLGPHARLVCLEDVTEAGDHYGFGTVLSELGDELAIVHLERCAEIWKSSLGGNARTTLNAMTTLANGYALVGKLEKALPLEKEVYEKRKLRLGPDHLDTLRAMGNLASTYTSLGKVQEALILEKEGLEKWERSQGPDHLDTLTAMGNLANSYRSLGRVTDALPLEEEVLEKSKRLLDMEHPDTLAAMGNLANSYRSVGRAKEALPLEEEVLEKRKKLLGPEHRHTLAAMRNLLSTLKALSMEKELKQLLEDSLPLHERVYGSDHKVTVRVRRLIAKDAGQEL